jgi:hypothetical protein
MQRGVIGIADRRHRGEAIEGAAQNDHDQAWLASAGSARGQGQIGRAKGGARPGQNGATGKIRVER